MPEAAEKKVTRLDSTTDNVDEPKRTKKPATIAMVADDKKKKGDDYLYAVGRRKTSIAQVRVYKKGDGSVVVNGKPLEVYFPTKVQQDIVKAPLVLIGQAEKLQVTVKVLGGGIIGQAEAIRQGVSRALILLNANFRKPLKKADYLTRDSRMKERKKPGLKGARRAPQWTKR